MLAGLENNTYGEKQQMYILFFLMAFNIAAGPVHAADIFMIGYIAYKAVKRSGKINIQKKWLWIFLIPVITVAAVIGIKTVFWKEIPNTDSFWFIFKIVLAAIYSYGFFQIGNEHKKYSFNILLIIVCMPLAVNILMYLSPQINAFLTGLYGVTPFPNSSRFGGIYGKDVNNLGLYATLVMITGYMFRKEHASNFFLFAASELLGLANIILCGMRAGLIALVICICIQSVFTLNDERRFVIYAKQIRIYFRYLLVGIIAFFIFLKFGGILFSDSLMESVLSRFSVEGLFIDFFGAKEGKGNLYIIGHYFMSQMAKCRNDSILFGYDTSVGCVDILFGEVFLRYGMTGIMLLGIFCIQAFVYAMEKKKRNMYIFWILFSVIISLKGIFILDSRYIFLTAYFCCCFIPETGQDRGWIRREGKHEDFIFN